MQSSGGDFCFDRKSMAAGPTAKKWEKMKNAAGIALKMDGGFDATPNLWFERSTMIE